MRRWWQSRLLRLFLVFVLTGWGSLIGSVLGIGEIVSNVMPADPPAVESVLPQDVTQPPPAQGQEEEDGFFAHGGLLGE